MLEQKLVSVNEPNEMPPPDPEQIPQETPWPEEVREAQEILMRSVPSQEESGATKSKERVPRGV